ncbi:MAG TPA: mechanosensitive ion channel [Candidatus Mailhella merdavium]|nr:mechanosensitive ion channel [Candidatus Mailhella merdavium]
MFRARFFLFLCALCLFCSAPLCEAAETSAPAAEQDASSIQQDESVQGIWEGIMSTRLKQLKRLQSDVDSFQQLLGEQAAVASQNSGRAREEYEKLSAIAEVSRNMPAELTVLVERGRRLMEDLIAISSPLETGMKNLKEVYTELSTLQHDSTALASPSVQSLNAQLSELGKRLEAMQRQMDTALAPILSLQTSLRDMESSLRADMPSLWRNYYLSAAGKLLDPAHWDDELEKTSSLQEVLSLRLSTEIPQSLGAWALVLVRMLVLLAPLLALLAVLNRAAAKAPALVRDIWTSIVRNSAFWLALGLALHFAAWSSGKMYQIIASFGTMSLCWGQMNMAWDLHAFDKPNLPRRSPLWPMFIPLFIGMMLLYFDPFPLFLSLSWLAVQSFILWRLHKRKPEDDRLVRILMGGFSVMCWISLALTLFGLVRLAILGIMVWVALSVCIQQALALLHVGTKLEDVFPQEGWRGLVAGISMALAIPAIMLILSAAPIIWILAYPGGAYLLEHVATMGFNVGKVSFNAMQVVSIFIAFYLTRSLISVGTTFMNSLRRQGVALNPSLIGPFQTTYTYALWALFILYVLSSLGFSLTSLTVVAGGLSVGVGFGMQNIVQNFISGLMVIFGRIIREGDVVEVGGILGVVRKVDIRSTQVETYDNAVVFIPNSQFLSNTFTNWTHNGRRVRRQITIGVAYGSNLQLCMKLLAQVASEHPRVLRTPAPIVYFDDFAASSLNLILRYWVADIDHGASTMTDIRLRVNELFTENNIEISFPQLDVHIKKDGSSPRLPDERGDTKADRTETDPA